MLVSLLSALLLVQSCDPNLCGNISFEELSVGNYPSLTWNVEGVNVSVMNLDMTDIAVVELFNPPSNWLARSLNAGNDVVFLFDPPIGKFTFSGTRMGAGEIFPTLKCYLDDRYIGGMISLWPADATYPQFANFFFFPIQTTFNKCILSQTNGDFYIDLVKFDTAPFGNPARLIAPRKVGK